MYCNKDVQHRTCAVNTGLFVSEQKKGVFHRDQFSVQLCFPYICCLWGWFLCNINCHLYADDKLQLYLPEADDCTCFTNFSGWLSNNFLQLNEDKTEFIIFGNRLPEKDLAASYGLLSNNKHGFVKNFQFSCNY